MYLEEVQDEGRRFLERDILRSIEVDILHETQDTLSAMKAGE